jgi:hypothetical protein
LPLTVPPAGPAIVTAEAANMANPAITTCDFLMRVLPPRIQKQIIDYGLIPEPVFVL